MTLHALPFPYRGTLVEQNGDEVRQDVPFAWWPARGAPGRAGVTHTHTGEAPLELEGELAVKNRSLVLEDGTSFRIVDVAAQQFLPHATLYLTRVRR